MEKPLYKISDIEKIYPNWYDPKSDLSRDDQKWMWENTPLPKEDEEKLRETKDTKKRNDYVLNGIDYGTHKLTLNSRQKLSKLQTIAKLRACGYKTPPREIASYLEIIFEKFDSYDWYWLHIAQAYTPKTINSVLALILKQHARGDTTIQNAAKYFSSVIRYRSKRKKFRRTNGTRKLQDLAKLEKRGEVNG